jgi:acyl-CoA synthetase (AMP-forming)/AMP-acid ligase II
MPLRIFLLQPVADTFSYPFIPTIFQSASDPVLAGIVADVADYFTEPAPLCLLTMPSAETLFPSLGAFKPSAQFEALPALERQPDYATACILHSSGSTAWPKPIHITERSALAWLCANEYGDYSYGPDICICALAAPLFHAMGFYWAIALPFATGARPVFFRPAVQREGTGVEAVTCETVFRAVSQVPCKGLTIAPSMLTVRLFVLYCVNVFNPDSILTWPRRKPRETRLRSKY